MKWAWLWRWAVLAGSIGAWQLLSVWGNSPFFPPPSVIVIQMHNIWFSGPASHLFLTSNAINNILPSLGRVIGGLAIAAGIAVPTGIAIGRSRAFGDFVDPLIEFARAIPAVTVAPVFIALFQIGTPMEVATIVFGTVWPILLNAVDGARSADPVQVETALVFHLSWFQRLTRLIIPGAAPKIFAGLRISLSLALVLMVFAELEGSTNGIGYEMNNAGNSFDLPTLWSGIAILGILGYALNVALLAVEHRVLAWYRGARQLTN